MHVRLKLCCLLYFWQIANLDLCNHVLVPGWRVSGPMSQSSVGQLSKMYSFILGRAVAFPESFNVCEKISVLHSSAINSPLHLAGYVVPNSSRPHMKKDYNCTWAIIAISMHSMCKILNKWVAFSSNTDFCFLVYITLNNERMQLKLVFG